MAIKLAFDTTMKMKELKTKMKSQIQNERKKIEAKFLKRKRIIERYMKGA